MTTDDSNPFGLTLYVFHYKDGDELEVLLTGDREAHALGVNLDALSVVNAVSGETAPRCRRNYPKCSSDMMTRRGRPL